MTGASSTGVDLAIAALLESQEPAGDPVPEPVAYDAFLAHRQLTRLSGRTVAGDSWSLIEKRTEGPALADPYLTANAEREFEAFTSGLLESLGTRLRAPRLLHAERDDAGALTLWQEDIRDLSTRPLPRADLLAAAADLGELAGRFESRVPSHPWLFEGWIDRHGQPEAVPSGRDVISRDVAGVLGSRREAVLGLIEELPRRAERLNALPPTLCHHDAVGANVLRDAHGSVLIDWESVGPGPLGADLASLIVSSVRRGDAVLSEAVAAVDDALAVYVDAARSAGAGATEAEIRTGFDGAVALRWKIAADLASAAAAGQPMRRGSRPDEDPATALGELDGLLDLILDRARRSPV